MPDRLVVILMLSLAALIALPGYGAGIEETVRAAGGLLEKGDAEAALTLLKEAQVDYPDAAALRFGIACAQYVKGERLSESGTPEEAKAAFDEARSLFSALAGDPDPRIAREAVFNGANTVAREALAAAGAGDHAAAVAALRSAVSAYEAGLARYPDHAGMRQNLDHVQLKLKELLQNPPQQEEQKDQQEQQPPEKQPEIVSLFGGASTELPGAQARVEENTAYLVPPQKQEQQP